MRRDNTLAILALIGLVAIVVIVALAMRKSPALPAMEDWELRYTPTGDLKGLTVRQLPSLQEVARALTK